MVPGGGAEPCILPAVLGSGLGIPMIGEKGLRCMQETWPNVQVVFPYEPEFMVAMDNSRSMLLAQQSCLLTVWVLTPKESAGLMLAEAVLLSRDGMLFLVLKVLHEKLNIDIAEGLNAKAFGPGVMEKGNQVAAWRLNTAGGIYTWHVSVPLWEAQRSTNHEERVSK